MWAQTRGQASVAPSEVSSIFRDENNGQKLITLFHICHVLGKLEAKAERVSTGGEGRGGEEREGGWLCFLCVIYLAQDPDLPKMYIAGTRHPIIDPTGYLQENHTEKNSENVENDCK